MKEVVLNQDNFQKEVLDYQGYVLVDFWATWCGPCQMIAPIIHEIAEECPEIKIGKVDVDQELQLAQSFRVVSIPTLLLFQDGKVVGQQIGYTSKEEIKKMWQK